MPTITDNISTYELVGLAITLDYTSTFESNSFHIIPAIADYASTQEILNNLPAGKCTNEVL